MGYNITVVHENPLIVQFEDFLTPAEMEALRGLGEPHMARSTVRHLLAVSTKGKKKTPSMGSLTFFLFMDVSLVVDASLSLTLPFFHI